MVMKHINKTIIALGALILLAALPTNLIAEDSVNSFSEAFTEGKAYANFRYRWENVDEDGFAKDANALTMRSRLGFDTATYKGFKAHVEIEDVHPTGNDNFNSGVNGKTEYPAVIDPQGTEINEAYLAYTDIPDTTVMGGRFALKIDDHRFIGDVGWRQNNQTFDGAAITNSSVKDLNLLYGWVGNVNRIFGEDSERDDLDANVHVVNAAYSGVEDHKFTAFTYVLDLDDEAPSLSTATFGGRYDGLVNVGDTVDVIIDASYAYQEDYGDNPMSYDANYYLIEGGPSFYGATFKVGYEVLGSDNGMAAFTTPLATLHKFNGWADKFLTTPATGLEDFYLSLAYKFTDIADFIDGLKLYAVYHDFSAEEGSADYGTEWNFSAVKPINDIFSAALHFAAYDSDGHSVDTDKFWATISAKLG